MTDVLAMAPLPEVAVDPGPDALHELVDAWCDRIEATEPQVHAFVPEPDRRDRLHQQADEMTARWSDPSKRPPLFALPLGVKDVMHTRGWTTRAGSAVDPAVFAGDEAPVVTRLRDAGALVVGKTVTAEFASKAPGETRNPFDLRRTPGGSSSGSAAAVALGTAALATGTQTIGSVVRPAAFCGIVGFKPTHGRVSIDGILPHSPSFDTPGVFARGLDRIRAAAAVMWGDWDATPTERSTRHRGRLVVATGDYLQQTEPDARQAFAHAVDVLRGEGWTVDEHDLIPDLDRLLADNLVINRYELAAVHAPWFDAHRRDYRRETVDAVEEGRALSRDSYTASRAEMDDFRRTLDARLAGLGVDAIITPAAPGPAPMGIETTGNPAMALPWTYAGLPAVSVPGGRSADGLPLGVQLVGLRGQDEALLAVAASVAPLVGIS